MAALLIKFSILKSSNSNVILIGEDFVELAIVLQLNVIDMRNLQT